MDIEHYLLGSDVQQTSLHPSKSIVHVKLGVEQQLWHWPFSKKEETLICYEDNITNSPGLSCLYEAQKKIKSSTFKTTAKSKYKTITTTTMLWLLLIIITYIFFIFLFLFFYPKKTTGFQHHYHVYSGLDDDRMTLTCADQPWPLA